MEQMLVPVEDPPIVKLRKDRPCKNQRNGTQQEDDTDLGDDRPGAKGAQWGLVGLRSMQLEG
jgi:hypothetical protein